MAKNKRDEDFVGTNHESELCEFVTGVTSCGRYAIKAIQRVGRIELTYCCQQHYDTIPQEDILWQKDVDK